MTVMENLDMGAFLRDNRAETRRDLEKVDKVVVEMER